MALLNKDKVMALDDLLKGLAVFDEGMTKLATGVGIMRAKQQVDEVNAQNLDDTKRRQALQSVANNLTLNLTAAGANPSQVQQTTAAVTPKSSLFPEEATAQHQSQVDKAAKERLQMQISANKEIARMRSDAKNAPKPIPPNQLEKLQKIDDAASTWNDILDKLNFNKGEMRNEIGPVAGLDIIKSWRNPEFGDFKSTVGRAFDQYRKEITGAGAGEKELRALAANVPKVTDTPALFETKIKTMLKIGEDVKRRRIDNLKKAKFDVSGFDDVGGQQPAAATEQSISVQSPDVAPIDVNDLRARGILK